MMIYLGRPGFGKIGKPFKLKLESQDAIRKDGTKKRKEELMEYLGYGIAFIIIVFFAGLLAWFAGKWFRWNLTGKLTNQ